jgi:hypothetical protein
MIAVFAEDYDEYIKWIRVYAPYCGLKKINLGYPYFTFAGIGNDTQKLWTAERNMPYIVLPGFHNLSQDKIDYAKETIIRRYMIKFNVASLIHP